MGLTILGFYNFWVLSQGLQPLNRSKIKPPQTAGSLLCSPKPLPRFKKTYEKEKKMKTGQQFVFELETNIALNPPAFPFVFYFTTFHFYYLKNGDNNGVFLLEERQLK